MGIYNLKGKTALVTGASSGIGFGISKSLAEEGVNLLLISRNEEKLKKAVDNLKSTTEARIEFLSGDVCDLSLVEESKSLINSLYGQCNILINNSGGPPLGNFLEFSDQEWELAYNKTFFQ